MTDILLKYKLLNKSAQKEVADFIDFLLKKYPSRKKNEVKSYKEKILNVSTWTESDIEEIFENQKKLNQWKTQEW